MKTKIYPQKKTSPKNPKLTGTGIIVQRWNKLMKFIKNMNSLNCVKTRHISEKKNEGFENSWLLIVFYFDDYISIT